MHQADRRLDVKHNADSQKMHEWLESLRKPLLRFCQQMTGSLWEAEDLVQDTMVRLLMAGAERPSQVIGFRYVCRTARNLWIDHCRRRKRVTVIAQTDAAELVVEGHEVSESGNRGITGGRDPHLTAYTAMDVREHLEELAWRLSPKPFVILLLMEVFDFTAKETAAWLGGTEVAVQVALSRARSRLKLLSRTAPGGEHAGGNQADKSAAKLSPMPAAFFETVLDAFRRREPAAIQEAYLSLAALGAQLQGIRAMGGKLFFTFQDPDGNVLMVSS